MSGKVKRESIAAAAKLIPTILCGGAGSRLWPVSRELHPKPFIRLADGQSLLQKAFLRGAQLPGVQEVLTVTGPYARTRNPLYLGSSLLALGAGMATNSWTSGVVLLLYFAVVYSFVMRREEHELRQQHGASFDAYARTVPLFFPRLIPANSRLASPGAYSFAQYKKNHEFEAAIGFLSILTVLLLTWKLRLP